MLSALVALFLEGRTLMEEAMEAIFAYPKAREVCPGHRA